MKIKIQHKTIDYILNTVKESILWLSCISWI